MTELRLHDRSDLGEFDRAVAETGDPELPGRATAGGRHLERTFSFDPQAFPEPNSRQELWRFAALPRLRSLFAAPAAEGEVAYSWSSAAPVEIVSMDDARVDSVHTPFDRVSAIARQNAGNAVVITVDGDAAPITLSGKGSGGVAYGHVVIDAKPHSKGTVVLDHAGSATYADNVEIRVGDGGALTVVTIQDWDDDTVHVSAASALVGRDAKLRHINVSFGGDAVRLTPLVKFAGPGGDAEMLGLFFADAGQHIDNRLLVDHSAPNCKSRVNYRGALQGDGARSVWTGDVIIRAEAVNTDTYEVNRNLLLTDGARADSVPNLEILTGEVVGAGHASATGRFDDEQVFYLQARGIPADQARRLIVRGFFADVIERIAVPEIVERLLATVDRELESTVA
ncbi:MAG TPA: Fe-S cluster assembly protein SufD [Acidothermaceae bacterium]|jgi:Fe-S cluster assembly protein SufD|nr:Fe-S cluster assembly protein SufD [Acidothermaceae bacterium]